MIKGLRNDQKDSTETAGLITKGDLHVGDLGYITPAYLAAVVDKETFFLNRVPPQCLTLTKNRKPINWKKTDACIQTIFKKLAKSLCVGFIFVNIRET